MALSVSANGGNGLANLFRQARPVKVEESSTPADVPATAVSLRPVGRSGIDSTGSGAAQISAKLTVYLSKLGSPDEQGSSYADPSTKASGSAAPSTSRSSAAELMRALDAYGSSQRLTA